jgi:hypothetical protein
MSRISNSTLQRKYFNNRLPFVDLSLKNGLSEYIHNNWELDKPVNWLNLKGIWWFDYLDEKNSHW